MPTQKVDKPAWIQHRLAGQHGDLCGLTPGALALYRKLAWHEGIHPHSQRRGVWHLVDELAAFMGVCVRTVQNAARQLADRGLIDREIVFGRGRRNLLTIRLTYRQARRAVGRWAAMMKRRLRKGARKVQRGAGGPSLKREKHSPERRSRAEDSKTGPRNGRLLPLRDILQLVRRQGIGPEASSEDAGRSAADKEMLQRKTPPLPDRRRQLFPSGHGELAFEGTHGR